MKFIRAQSQVLSNRLTEPVARIQIVAGPRQVGKSTLVRQTLESWNPDDYTSVATETGGSDGIGIESGARVFALVPNGMPSGLSMFGLDHAPPQSNVGNVTFSLLTKYKKFLNGQKLSKACGTKIVQQAWICMSCYSDRHRY